MAVNGVGPDITVSNFCSVDAKIGSRVSALRCGLAPAGGTRKDHRQIVRQSSLASSAILHSVQVALLDLITSWDIQPQVVCGHSSGEIAAAYAAGLLTASEALQVAYFRGFQVEALRESSGPKGAILAVGISAEGVLAYIEPGDKVIVACYNKPQSATLSSDSDGVILVKAKLDAQGVFARKLDVDVAYHSSHMKLVEANYHAVMQNLHPKRCKDGDLLYSSVTEEPLDGTEMGASYRTQNLVSLVRFSQALSNLLIQRDTWLSPGLPEKSMIIEDGPHAALEGPITQNIKANGTRGPRIYQNTLTRGDNGPKVLPAASE